MDTTTQTLPTLNTNDYAAYVVEHGGRQFFHCGRPEVIRRRFLGCRIFAHQNLRLTAEVVLPQPAEEVAA